MKSNLLLLLAVVPLVALAACDNPVDTSENVLPYLSEVSDAAATDVDTAAGVCDCLAVGQWFRFDTLDLTTLDEDAAHPVVATLNPLWSTDIASEHLNILFEVIAVSPTEVTMRSYSGAHNDGADGYCLLPVTAKEVVFPREGCLLNLSNAGEFVIYAGTEQHPKNCSTTLPVPHVIPISSARLSGRVSETCDTIGEGLVPEGGLGELELGSVCTCLADAEQCGDLDPAFVDVAGNCAGCNASYQNLKVLLNAFGALEWKCQADSGRAACLTATWSAVALDQTPPMCTH